ncbi:MAG: F0F1 ATP synthase subunit epsilon [Limnochordaceae bacterium]|nr:F0F1 ATP synthase subunit epsilon [Limnochordaceae bacterium]
MAELMQLEVVTPQRVVLRERVEAVVAPTDRGYLGVLANHAPMVAALSLGIVQFGRYHGPKRKMAVSGGFMEVSGNRVTILADTAELAEEIDVLRAKAARDRALERLRSRAAHIDQTRAERALARALNRLRAAGAEEERR